MGRRRTCDCGTCPKCVHRAAEAKRKAAWLALTDEERAERTAAYRESRDAPLEKRLWAKVDIRSLDDCWPWKGALGGPGYRDGTGYPKIGDARTRVSPLTVTRVICEWTFGPPPTPQYQACHACDNPPCCNPLHLFWGPPKENVADMVRKGRHRATRSLTNEQVEEVKRRYMAGELQRVIAADLGVTQATVSRVVRGVTYGDRP